MPLVARGRISAKDAMPSASPMHKSAGRCIARPSPVHPTKRRLPVCNGGYAVADVPAGVQTVHRDYDGPSATQVNGVWSSLCTADVGNAIDVANCSTELVNLHAYLLWVDNDKPFNADFSQLSEGLLVDMLRTGRNLPELQEELCAKRDGLLTSCLDEDYNAMVYSVLFKFGDTGRFVAVLRDAGGEDLQLEIISDSTKDLVMHWGVCYQSDMSDWACPPEDILPGYSTYVENGEAANTYLSTPGADGLRRVSFNFSKSRHSMIRGLHFAMRMADDSRWFWDGGEFENFKLPLPQRKPL